jgi:hypothetical protein
MTEFIIILGVLYYIFDELEDKCIRNKWEVYPELFNSKNTWKNKWKLDLFGNLIPYKFKWYHFGVHPKYEEKFPYSSTILVGLTDPEHLFQEIKYICVYLAFLILGFKYFLFFFIGKSISSFTREAFKVFFP